MRKLIDSIKGQPLIVKVPAAIAGATLFTLAICTWWPVLSPPVLTFVDIWRRQMIEDEISNDAYLDQTTEETTETENTGTTDQEETTKTENTGTTDQEETTETENTGTTDQEEKNKIPLSTNVEEEVSKNEESVESGEEKPTSKIRLDSLKLKGDTDLLKPIKENPELNSAKMYLNNLKIEENNKNEISEIDSKTDANSDGSKK